MIGLQLRLKEGETPKDYAKKCLKSGLLVLTAGTDVMRFLPPLNISYDEIGEGLDVLKDVLMEE
jgi:acetylornithine/N-succinyldiaminopimelate aminotransferase